VVSTSRTVLATGAVTTALTALAFAIPTASAASLPEVNGHTDNWVNEGSPSVVYDNGYRVDSASEVADALGQCKSSGVSCAATAVGTPSQVTKWYDVENAGTGTGPIEACGAGEGEINQTIGGSHTFTWGWNIGINADVTLVKDVLKVGASAQYNETHADTKSGDIRITIKKGEKGMLKMGHDMERGVSDVTIQGGRFGGAKITGLRTEIPLKGGLRVGTDVVKCGETLMNDR
jgi:hypothetical protein